MAKELALTDFDSGELERIQKNAVLWRALLMALDLANGIVDDNHTADDSPDRMIEYVEAFTHEKFPRTALVLSQAFWGGN
ncbi:MAG TPA: hypothetical protein VLH19_01400 [Patescibacteria group bacterium]|nr:hypothetical protein [Patescibacteria group bacterium]